ncbi:MAG: hypothetical protein ACI9KE_004099 [Polyangiales bacterium]|jgi:hypothetical protein
MHEDDIEDTKPSLDACLAYAVLNNPDDWLSTPSPTALQVFLLGAKQRAAVTDPSLNMWRIHGPLNEPKFYKPLVARTGHPLLSIRWATALELLHYSMTDAMTELLHLLEARFSSLPLPGPNPYDWDQADFWRHLARRPAMFFGSGSGQHLGWYLAGFQKGGDWLGLPPDPEADAIIEAIHQHSKESYGSEFGAFRVYDSPGGATTLLGWAGVEPIEDAQA